MTESTRKTLRLTSPELVELGDHPLGFTARLNQIVERYAQVLAHHGHGLHPGAVASLAANLGAVQLPRDAASARAVLQKVARADLWGSVSALDLAQVIALMEDIEDLQQAASRAAMDKAGDAT